MAWAGKGLLECWSGGRGAVRFRRCGRGAGESGSADRTFSPINAYRKELRRVFFFFPSSSIHEKEVRKLLISFHGGQPQQQQLRQRQQLLPSSLATCAAILMKINMPLVGVAAYDFDICRHFALACPPRCLDGSPQCVCLSICLSSVYGMLKII